MCDSPYYYWDNSSSYDALVQLPSTAAGDDSSPDHPATCLLYVPLHAIERIANDLSSCIAQRRRFRCHYAPTTYRRHSLPVLDLHRVSLPLLDVYDVRREAIYAGAVVLEAYEWQQYG